jgi:hypothetical protein
MFYFLLSVGVLAKLALLQAWVCVSACAACKCANVRWEEFQNILCGGKKIKHEALGCRVGKKSGVKFICRPVVSIIVSQFNGYCVVCYACL